MPITLRDADETDAADIAAFHLRVWRVAYHDFAPPQIMDKLDYQTRLAYWIAKLGNADPHRYTLLAIEDAAIVGFACFGTTSGSSGEIKHLFIDPDHQGQGLGRCLLFAAFEQLSQDQCKTADLAVTDDNKPAIAFYHAMGGTITDQRTNAGPIWKSRDLIMSWGLPVHTSN